MHTLKRAAIATLALVAVTVVTALDDVKAQGIGASAAKAAAERAAGGRAVGVRKRGNVFVVIVKSRNAVRRCRVDANSGRVLGC